MESYSPHPGTCRILISPDEMLESPTVAVEFARKLYGSMAWIMPIFIACSTIGSANGVILTSSRYVPYLDQSG